MSKQNKSHGKDEDSKYQQKINDIITDIQFLTALFILAGMAVVSYLFIGDLLGVRILRTADGITEGEIRSVAEVALQTVFFFPLVIAAFFGAITQAWSGAKEEIVVAIAGTSVGIGTIIYVLIVGYAVGITAGPVSPSLTGLILHSLLVGIVATATAAISTIAVRILR